MWYINWDVNEVIIEGLPFRWYSIMFLMGFLIGYFIFRTFFKRENDPEEWLDSLLMYMVLATILGARIGHCLFYDWDYFSQHPLEILLPVKFEPTFRFTGFQGLASHGGAIGILTALWIWSRRISKRPVLWIMDRMVIPAALTGAFIRMGNLLNSEIVGKQTDVAWGFIFKRLGEDFPRHPVQLYESIGYFFIFWLLYYMYWKTDARLKLGRLFGTFFFTIFGVRFLLEYFKRSQGGFETFLGDALTTGQWLSIPFILMGLYFMFRPEKRYNRKDYPMPKVEQPTTRKKKKSKA